MAPRLETTIGAVTLKNPVICGAGEHVMTVAGIRAALAAGAGAVVAKSFNESAPARDQLDRTDYVLLDARFRPLPWNFDPPPEATLACRSGLIRTPADVWIDTIAGLDREAAAQDSYVIASIILAELDPAVALARRVAAAGIRVLEFNIGTPYGDEAGGAVSTERAAARVRDYVAAICGAVDIPVWAKITGQSESVSALVAAARDGGAAGVVMMGRFLGMVPDIETRAPMLGTNLGIGGSWALPLTCYWLARARQALGPGMALVATNGARDGLDVVRMMLAGARAVELSTAVMTGGFDVLARAVATLDAYLADAGMMAPDLVGLAADRIGSFADQPSRPGHWTRFVPPEARPGQG
jgi:dihydroorotate dehydrogenase (NAD+) catalytic subunit